MSLRPEMCLFTNQSSYSACMMVLLLNPFVSPFFLHNCVYIGDDLWLVRNDFNARHKYCRDIYNVVNWTQHCWNQGVMAFTRQDMGCMFHEWISVMAGWIAEVLLCCSMLNRENIGVYKAYWFMGLPIINHWGVHACHSCRAH